MFPAKGWMNDAEAGTQKHTTHNTKAATSAIRTKSVRSFFHNNDNVQQPRSLFFKPVS